MRTRVMRPKLTAEQEIELARRVHGPDPADAIAARDELVLSNFGLVGHIVGGLVAVCPSLDYDDLFAEALVLLVQLAEQYDPDTYHTRFSSFAAPHIRGTLRNYANPRRREIPALLDPPDPARSVLERIVTGEEMNAAAAALGGLDPTRAYIVARRFGLGAPVRTLRELATELGWSYEYVRQLEAKALRQLSTRARLQFTAPAFEMPI